MTVEAHTEIPEPVEPRELAALVDHYQELRAYRLEEEKRVAEIKRREKAKLAQIIISLQSAGMTAVGARTHTASLVRKDEPVVEEWDPLLIHIAATHQFDLIQRRLSPVAVRMRWDDGVQVPGVVAVETVNLSLTKNRGA